MKSLLIHDPITHESFGEILTTNPELWEEWAEQPISDSCAPDSDTTSWAELYGIEED